MKKRNGFTLVEILMVVVIIGVLAALILPRFLAAPERAMIGEANYMLGALSRAQQLRTDTGLTFLDASPFTTAIWNNLGIQVPASVGKFTYTCTSPTCTASRTVNGTASTAVVNPSNAVWTCSGAYTTLSNGGCKLA